MSRFIGIDVIRRSKREFVNANEEITQHLKCCICAEVFEDPVRTICG